MTRTAAWLLVVAAAAAACTEDGRAPDEAATTATTLAGSTVSAEELDPDFEGDSDSAFCRRSRAAADQPVLDPFASGLEPREVELRFRALASRFRAFEDVAPPPLAGDLELLVATFDDFAELLESADYDFDRLAERDVDLSLFDDPALARVATRLEAYQDQVCRRAT